MASLLAFALAAPPHYPAAINPQGDGVAPPVAASPTPVAASPTWATALLGASRASWEQPGKRPALCPAGTVGWHDRTATCCDASCSVCSDAGCGNQGAACCASKIVAAAVPCDNATDTGCVGVAASTVAKAKAEDAAHLSDAKAEISMATGGDGPSPTRILGLTSSTCRPSDTNARLLDTLQKSCERYPGLKLIVNLFDLSKAEAEAAGGCFLGDKPPSCLSRITHMPGHKATFWRDVAPAEEVRKNYDYVFAFDNDMRIADDGFDLERAASLLRRSGAAMGQPRIKIVEPQSPGSGSLFGAAVALVSPPSTAGSSRNISLWRTGPDAKGEEEVAEKWNFLSDPLPAGCGAVPLEYVENQAPLFTTRGWATMHSRLLSQLDEGIFRVKNWGISSTWCRVVERYSAHARGCVLVDEQLATTDERTIEALHLTKDIRTSHKAKEFFERIFPLEFKPHPVIGWRGECAASVE